MADFSLLLDQKHMLGECVRWCERSARLFWTDIPAAKLWAHHPASGELCSWPMPERLASFAFTESADHLLLGLASQLAMINLSSGEWHSICEVESELPTTRINDGRCDRQGNFIFGTMNEAADHAKIASIYRLDKHLHLQRLQLDKLAIANSICFSPDGTIMYYCDSLAKTLRCCDYDAATGEVTRDRQFTDLSQEPGVPDGSTIDSSGYLWNAQWGGHRVVRYAPDGSVERILRVPVEQPSCVTFGGPHLQQLFVSSARDSMSPEVLLSELSSGGLFLAQIDDTHGIFESRFAGNTKMITRDYV